MGPAAVSLTGAAGRVKLISAFRVGFVKLGQEPLVADFDRAWTEIGDLMEPQDMYPPRYLVKGFPTVKELALIGRELT